MKTNLIKRLITITAALTITLTIGAAGVYAQLQDNRDGTITDTGNNLVWLKNADCFGYATWDNAMAKAQSLQSGMCGLTDRSVTGQWRLPTLSELQTRFNNFAGFSNVKQYYWSSTILNMGSVSSAAYLDVIYPPRLPGSTFYAEKNSINDFWPVRAVMMSPPRIKP